MPLQPQLKTDKEKAIGVELESIFKIVEMWRAAIATQLPSELQLFTLPEIEYVKVSTCLEVNSLLLEVSRQIKKGSVRNETNLQKHHFQVQMTC